MSSSTSDLDLNAITLNTAVDKVNLTYILKFRLALSIIQYINTHLILNDIHINDFIIVLDIKLNS